MRLPRPQIERLANGIIAGLDAMDGDSDLEPDADAEVERYVQAQPSHANHDGASVSRSRR
jgi:hypothetical protein